ncbi:MAG TPA: ABC transporter permease, partial [Candidatus Krumholzibacterium sp.]|nr:ABC transporter permease [Candidatus Krumholzibacterium sp.]
MKAPRPSPPRFARTIIGKTSRSGNRDAVISDLDEEFEEIALSQGAEAARRWYRRQALSSVLPFLAASFSWNLALVRADFRIAARNLAKNRGYSLLNILGLSAGIACCIFIFLFVKLETSYDSFHPDADRVFRVARSRKTPAKHDLLAMSYVYAAPILKERFQEVEVAARAHKMDYRYVRVDGRTYMHDRVIEADQEIFDLMSIPFLEGDVSTALSGPGTAVITRSLGE